MNRDTFSLLGDCTAGIELTVSTIDGVLPNVKDQLLRRRLQDGIRSHEALRDQSLALLQQGGAAAKPLPPMTKRLTQLQITTRLALGRDDPTAADVVAHSCDRGVRELCRSRNRYTGADYEAQSLADRLIACQENLSSTLRSFL